jgi:hypothetical protein
LVRLSHAVGLGLAAGVLVAAAVIVYVAPKPSRIGDRVSTDIAEAAVPRATSVARRAISMKRQTESPTPLSAQGESDRADPPNVAVAETPANACSLSSPPPLATTISESEAFVSPRTEAVPLDVLRADRRLHVLTRVGDWLLVQFSNDDLAASDPHTGTGEQRKAYVHCSHLSATTTIG